MLSGLKDIIPSWSEIHEEEENALLLINDSQKKQDGVFFTPDPLVKLAIKKIHPAFENDKYLDPSCGTGNLLLEVISLLEIKDHLEETLLSWNNQIFGLDINENFISITKKKIIRFAVDRGCIASNETSMDTLLRLLSNIKRGDFIEEYKSYIGLVDHVIMNPPFCSLLTPKCISWTSGKSNAAGLFLYFSNQIIPLNGKIIGILPDVLRSGARYKKLRTHLNNHLKISIEPYGEFQKSVQVDVFIFEGKKISDKCESKDLGKLPNQNLIHNLEADFVVSVGPVVPHRDPAIGDEAPYIHAKTLLPWGEINTVNERIIHKGRKIAPPFVAIRRTSSPKDKRRIIGTIINCSEAVAVENHIIVAIPKSGGLQSCRKLLNHLSTIAVSEYVNSQIRCRHLTVGVVKGIPLEYKINDY